MLGIPVGSPTFIRTELSEFEHILANDTFEILRRFLDLQTVGQAYKISILARVPYRLFAAAMECMCRDKNFLDTDPLDWKSTFSDNLNSLSRRVFASVISQEALPDYAWDVLRLQDKGGFRVFDPALSVPASFVVSVIKSTRHTHNGLDLRD